MEHELFFKMPFWLSQRHDLSFSAKMLMALLLDYSRINDNGVAWPSVRRIMSDLGVASRSCIQIWTEQLKRKGLLKVESGRGIPNQYTPSVPVYGTPQEDGVSQQVGHRCPSGRDSTVPVGGNDSEQYQDQHQEHSAAACASAPSPPFSPAQTNGAESNTGRRRPHQSTQLPDQPSAPGSETDETAKWFKAIRGKRDQKAEGSALARPGRTLRKAEPSAGVAPGVAPGAGPKPTVKKSLKVPCVVQKKGRTFQTPPDGQGSLLRGLVCCDIMEPSIVQPPPRQRRESASKGAATTRKRKKAAKARPRDELWDAYVDEWMGGTIADGEEAKVGRNVKQLRQKGATARTLRERSAELREEAASPRKGFTVSEYTILKRWARYGRLERERAAEKRRKRAEQAEQAARAAQAEQEGRARAEALAVLDRHTPAEVRAAFKQLLNGLGWSRSLCPTDPRGFMACDVAKILEAEASNAKGD